MTALLPIIEEPHGPGILPECRRCRYWFLGCLRGRDSWHDKADTPNFRWVGLSGRAWDSLEAAIAADDAFPPGLNVPQSYPLDRDGSRLLMVCDGFEWDFDPERFGRAVWPR